MLYKKWIVTIVLTVAAWAALGCEIDEGSKVDVTQLGYLSCSANADCMPKGYCNSSNYCASQCRDDKDCWQFSPIVECCPNQKKGDEVCCEHALYYEECLENPRNVECRDQMTCVNYQCLDANGLDKDGNPPAYTDEGTAVVDASCRYKSPEECLEFGWREFCGNRDCLDYGWKYFCDEETEKCDVAQSIDFGEADEATTDDFVGVWGGILTTAARTKGIPLRTFQDTVSFHVTLTRASLQDGKVVFDSHMCYMEMRNFDEEKVYEVGEDVGQLIIPPSYYNNVKVLKHVIEQPPAFEVGKTFKTTDSLEVRGARLEDYENDELPDRTEYNETCEPWEDKKDDPTCRTNDPDEDGKPGYTNIGIGALDNQETYHNQRWSCSLEGEIIDNDHISGLLPNENLQYQLSGSVPSMVYDIEVKMHPDTNRSYFRLLRMDPDATCEDVMAEHEAEGGWLSYTPFLEDIENP